MKILCKKRQLLQLTHHLGAVGIVVRGWNGINVYRVEGAGSIYVFPQYLSVYRAVNEYLAKPYGSSVARKGTGTTS